MDDTQNVCEKWLTTLLSTPHYKNKPVHQHTVHLAVFGNFDAMLRGPPELECFKATLERRGFQMRLSALTWNAELKTMDGLDCAWIHPKPEIGENKRYRTLSVWRG